MSFIDRNRKPSQKELNQFGGLLATFCGLLGGLSLYKSSSWTMATLFWSAGVIVAILYYAVPTLRMMIFQTWMGVVYPIGWFISHAMLAGIYYAVITPIGAAHRLWNRDPLQQKRDLSTRTYWVPCSIQSDIKRYFQQY